MHYKNGREAKVGDQIVGKSKWDTSAVAGVIVSISPGSSTCNAMVVPSGTQRCSVTLSDMLHVEDAYPTEE